MARIAVRNGSLSFGQAPMTLPKSAHTAQIGVSIGVSACECPGKTGVFCGFKTCCATKSEMRAGRPQSLAWGAVRLLLGATRWGRAVFAVVTALETACDGFLLRVKCLIINVCYGVTAFPTQRYAKASTTVEIRVTNRNGVRRQSWLVGTPRCGVRSAQQPAERASLLKF
jgi:hypothetical protein